MKGVILAGGKGTRLGPLTDITNKHLLPVYDKPMILYPLETLKGMGITDILIVTGGDHVGDFAELLGDGSKYEVNLTYRVQEEAGGIAQALLLAEDYVGERFAVILGDNIFAYPVKPLADCGIVVKEVEDPERFGVFQDNKIVEKPQNPTSSKAVLGLYFYTKDIFPHIVRTLEPSERGELEITDVNNWCLEHLSTEVIDYQGFWSDAGTFDSLMKASVWAYNEALKSK
jgi:glucose-1-phosphate thymidylyltransferase